MDRPSTPSVIGARTNGVGSAEWLDRVPIRVFIFEMHWVWREALVAVLRHERDIEIAGVSEEVEGWVEEAVKVCPDVVVAELLLKDGASGAGAALVLKERLPEVKIIVFTEFASPEMLRSAVLAGASGFLLKREVQGPESVVSAIHSVHSGGGCLTPLATAKILEVMQREATRDRHRLTSRELQVLGSIAEGHDNRRIARALGIAERTVANHVSNLLFKMSARNRTEATAIARREGLLDG